MARTTEPDVTIGFNTTSEGSFTSVGSYVDRITYSTGATRAFDAAQAGRATVRLDNRDGRFDPSNTGSPYYPYVIPGNMIQIKATKSSTSWLWVGVIESYDIEFTDPDGSWVTITAIDPAGYIARYKAADSVVAGYTRPVDMLLYANVAAGISAALYDGVPAERVTGDYGDSAYDSQYLAGVNLLAAGQSLAASDIGWYSPGGHYKFQWVSRGQRHASSIATFSDNPSAGQHDYESVTMSYSSENDIEGAAVTGAYPGATAVYYPTTVDDTYRLRTLSTYHASEADARICAQLVYEAGASDGPFFSSLTFTPDTSASSATIWNVVRDLGDNAVTANVITIGSRITVTKTTPYSTTITKDCFVEGWTVDIPPVAEGKWTVTLALSDASHWATTGLILDNATTGKLNTGTLG